jgi:signal transduction histidine kinase
MGMLSRQFLSGLTVSLELDPTCPAVRGSGAQLEQVLLNLVVNAAEAMSGRGRLTVSARPVSHAADLALAPAGARAYVELAVRDSGPGMAPEHLARIFEPFFTTKAGRTQPGTGLGLSVVDTIARQSGWGLGVRSQPGEGAEFVVLLPASEQGREPPV